MVIGQPINNSQSIGCPKWHQTYRSTIQRCFQFDAALDFRVIFLIQILVLGSIEFGFGFFYDLKSQALCVVVRQSFVNNNPDMTW